MESGLDLHAKMVNEKEEDGFGGLGEDEKLVAVSEREIWLDDTTNHQDDDDLLGMNMNDDASVFYADFPSLPDFPCMSSASCSSSSSSSCSTPLKTIACTTTSTTTTTATSSSSSASSSSAASWAVLKSEGEEDHHGEKMKSCDDNNNNQGFLNMHDPLDHHGQHAITLASTPSLEIPQQQQEEQDLGVGGECMEDVMMDTFGYMELLETNEFFDPSSIFQTDEENPLVDDFTQEQVLVQQQHHPQVPIVLHDDGETKPDLNFDGGACDSLNDEMSSVFLEWLKSNKDSVSANDLRNVKLRKSTIESAARRLGGGKEGMKQLLKLILEWVQTSHLQSKRLKENNNNTTTSNPVPQQPQPQFQDLCPNQNTTNSCFNQTSWIDQTQTQTQMPLVVPPQQFSQPMVGVGYVGDIHYTNGSVSNNLNHNINLYQHGSGNEYHQFNVVPSYNQPSFVDSNNNVLQPHGLSFGGYGNQYGSYQFFHGGGGDRLMRLGPSATKEARKKRMARQRRFVPHHRNHQNQGSDSVGRLRGGGGGDNCTNDAGVNQGSWMYWQSMAGGKATAVPAEPAQQPVERDRTNNQTQNSHLGRNVSDKKQGWKPEKNLKFLLQKVLKQSDVGSLGRIVLPKKEAETHLPELEARDGITITMEDIGTSRVWNMRYSIRYWPNNKSRMYLLENTGDFVKANGLQEGDFIVLYSDVKCGKFMIRGVKVRQQGAKPEAKKTGKAQKNQQHENNSNTAGNEAVDNNDIPSSPKRRK
ncbi:B3 domain-containing transcription factor ABI3 isoform X1 [Vicia villosa]|uniref:B3 domain-containing transcription factor ABI3 isoform X1 n=1 Tax=Vicia villosa TaxID=3911 RepID=UPI00273BD3D7|nr:B3 domain-containing transcription factor ABI3 isoform X1 [Vicia villosa]XP_058739634.1 B3 domain-containing transcription factor ABI3 isoform X1 [Vicia villosa]